MTTPDPIARLEAADKGSRELDLEVHKAAKLCDPSAWYSEHFDQLEWNEHHPEAPGGADEFCTAPLPHYTTNFDAALTLVRGDLWWRVEGRGKAFTAQIGKSRQFHAGAAGPALAICIAAFRAREAV